MFKSKRLDGLRTTLGARMMRFLVTSVLESVLILSIYSCITLFNVLKTNNEQQALGYAKSYSLTITESMNLLRTQLENAGEKSDFYNTSIPMETRKELLAEEAASDIGYKDLSIAFSDGKTYNDTDISERNYFQSAMNGTTFISSPVIRKTDGKLAIIAGAKINNDNFDGVIYGGIDTDYFASKIQNIKFGKAGYGFIVDKNGTIIGHPDLSVMSEMINPVELAKTDSSYKEYASIIEKMKSGGSGTSVFRMNDNKRYLIGYAPVDGAEGWSLGVMIPYSEVTSSFNISVLIYFIITLVLVGYGVPVCIIFNKKITAPIISVSERLKALADGDLHTPAPVNNRGDETQLLAESMSNTLANLNSYIGDIAHVLGSVADGDMTVESNVHYAGDFDKIKSSLNTILSSLNSTLSEVGRASDQVYNAASQVAAGASTLSLNTATEAGTVEEFSATLMDILQNINNTAQNAKEAAALTEETNIDVKSGNQSMADMLTAINDIQKAADQISRIITVIDDIAFQTNILALNAAVEAARAGAAGKGFAVVADEVRNLAAKSAEAAKQTGTLIQNTIASVKKGTSLADVTANSLSAVVENVGKVTKLIESISFATEEQSLSITQINAGMDQINNSIQTTSATAEESAASSEELSGQANTLHDRVSKFKVKN